LYFCDMEKNYKELKDHKGKWYWIPKDSVSLFMEDSAQVDNSNYPMTQFEFDDNWSDYATGGAKDRKPNHYLSEQRLFDRTETELKESLYVSVQISSYERNKIVIQRLIELYSAEANLVFNKSVGNVLRFFLTKDEFEYYVTEGNEL